MLKPFFDDEQDLDVAEVYLYRMPTSDFTFCFSAFILLMKFFSFCFLSLLFYWPIIWDFYTKIEINVPSIGGDERREGVGEVSFLYKSNFPKKIQWHSLTTLDSEISWTKLGLITKNTQFPTQNWRISCRAPRVPWWRPKPGPLYCQLMIAWAPVVRVLSQPPGIITGEVTRQPPTTSNSNQ